MQVGNTKKKVKRRASSEVPQPLSSARVSINRMHEEGKDQSSVSANLILINLCIDICLGNIQCQKKP